jgi:hypothetical protein
MEIKLHPIKWLNPSITKILITKFVDRNFLIVQFNDQKVTETF